MCSLQSHREIDNGLQRGRHPTIPPAMEVNCIHRERKFLYLLFVVVCSIHCWIGCNELSPVVPVLCLPIVASTWLNPDHSVMFQNPHSSWSAPAERAIYFPTYWIVNLLCWSRNLRQCIELALTRSTGAQDYSNALQLMHGL